MPRHTHNGRPCKSFGSCATENFDQIAKQKHEMAQKMKKGPKTPYKGNTEWSDIN